METEEKVISAEDQNPLKGKHLLEQVKRAVKMHRYVIILCVLS